MLVNFDKNNKTIVLLSLADMSCSNGQGVFSRKVLTELYGELTRKKCNVKLVAPKPKFPSALPSFFLKEGVWLSEKKNRNILWHLYSQIMVFYFLLKLRPSTVVFSVKPSFFGVELARKIVGFDKVILVEGVGKRSLKTLGGKVVVVLGRLGFRMVFYKAKAIFVAYESALEWVKEYKVNCYTEVIPCGVDISIFNPANVGKGKSGDRLNGVVIGYVGSFRKVHRLDLLVLQLLEDNRLYLKLVGVGENYGDIKKLVAFHKLESRVEFLGNVPQVDMPKIFSSCSMMWAFTDVNHWGVPIKAFEYLACNKYVIVSKRKEFDFINDYNFGVVLSNNDVTDISQKLGDLIDRADMELSLDVQSFPYIEEHHNWMNYRKVAAFVC